MEWLTVPSKRRNSLPSNGMQGKRTCSATAHTPTSNVYTPLYTESNSAKNHETEIRLSRSAKTVDNCKKFPKIPPITIIGKTRSEIISFCRINDVATANMMMKPTSTGINLYINVPEKYVTARELFKTYTQSFSHDMRSEKYFKVVLKGLFSMETERLMEELATKNIFPQDIKVMTPKKPRYSDEANYLLFFSKGNLTLNDFRRNCRSLSCLMIEWELYIPNRYGPTQCHRCQKYGHGYKYCSLPLKCRFCAGDHETKTCTGVKDGVMQQNFLPKCSNCGQGHTANYEKCPELQRYTEIQQNINAKNSRKSRQRQTQRVAFDNMPPPGFQKQGQHSQSYKPPQNSSFHPGPSHSGPSYAQVLGSQNFPQNSNSYSHRKNELFNPTELVQVAHELITTLTVCKTKEQQYMALVNLAAKFLQPNDQYGP